MDTTRLQRLGRKLVRAADTKNALGFDTLARELDRAVHRKRGPLANAVRTLLDAYCTEYVEADEIEQHVNTLRKLI